MPRRLDQLRQNPPDVLRMQERYRGAHGSMPRALVDQPYPLGLDLFNDLEKVQWTAGQPVESENDAGIPNL